MKKIDLGLSYNFCSKLQLSSTSGSEATAVSKTHHRRISGPNSYTAFSTFALVPAGSTLVLEAFCCCLSTQNPALLPQLPSPQSRQATPGNFSLDSRADPGVQPLITIPSYAHLTFKICFALCSRATVLPS